VTERNRLLLLLAPFAAGACLLVVLPAAVTFGFAFTDYDGIARASNRGFDNFRFALSDPFLSDSLRATALFLAFAIPLRLAAATALALLLHRRFPGSGAARSAAFLPSVLPEGATALVLAFLLNPVYGPVSAVIGIDWFSSPGGALAMFVLLATFTVGEGFLVLLAVRSALPREYADAAAVEGASAWHFTRRVTLPLLAPALVLLACRDLTLAAQSVFSAGYLITDGGPDRATLFLPLYIYDVGFEQLRLGYAAMLSLLSFLVTGLALAVAWRVLRRHDRLGAF
jgi:multiple sugar transport system permease protein